MQVVGEAADQSVGRLPEKSLDRYSSAYLDEGVQPDHRTVQALAMAAVSPMR